MTIFSREKSITRKIYEEARDFYRNKYTNDVTVKNYCLIYKRFLKYCRENYNTKTKEECEMYIQEYIDYLISNNFKPSTVHTVAASICSYHNIPLGTIKKPKRVTSQYTRGRPNNNRTERNDNDMHNATYNRLVQFQKCVGIRRSELVRLTSDDYFEQDGNFYVCVRRGKGGRYQEQFILPEDVPFVKSYFTNTPSGEKIFSKEEMNNHLDLHSLRAQAAKNTYTYLEEQLKLGGDNYRKKLENELREKWNKFNINPITNNPRPFPENRLTGKYFLRGKSKEFAMKNNLPTSYDRLLVFYVSVQKLTHYRLSVTVQSYLNILTYDEMGNIIKQVTPLDTGLTNVKKMYYDGAGNLVKEVISAGETESDTTESVTEYSYDGMGNVTDISYLTKAGTLVYNHYEYNDAGRLIKMYTGLSVPYSEELPSDAYSLTTYAYNDMGYLISETDALGKVTQYEYDLYGNLLAKTLPNGTEYTYEYDIFGRVTEDNAWSTPDTVMEDGISYEYDTLGNVTSVKKSSWNSASGTELASRTKTPEVTYTYNNLGRLTAENSTVGGKTIAKSYTYNQFGNETGFTLTVNGTAEIQKTSTYDDLLRLETVTQDGDTTTYTYDANGNLATETTGDIVTTYTYNDSNMVTSMGTNLESTVVTDFDYLYSRNGNQRKKTDNVTGVVTAYEYDLIGQLTEEQKTNGTTVTLKDSYTYDANGNRLTKVEERPGTAIKTVTSTYNKNNQLISTTADGVVNNYTYDNVGNMLTDGVKTYTYSTRNQQKTFANGDASASYAYYYDGLRKSKTVGTNTTYFIWHNGNMVYEFTPTDSNSYTYGLRLISSDDAKFVLNAHGDVVVLIDSTGTIIKRYDYDAFGNELNIDSTDTNPFRYCAEYFDKDTGSIYLRARYYQPVTGRFTQIDPIKDGINWYAYCYNNPIIYIDKNGEFGVIATILISAAIGAAFDVAIQITSNCIEGKEWHDGIIKAGVVGGITGGIGGGISKINSASKVFKMLRISSKSANIIKGATSGVVGELIEKTAYGENITVEDITGSIISGITLGAIDEKVGNYVTKKLTDKFANLSLPQQKQLLQSISNTKVTSSYVREIRRALKNDATPELVDELINQYGYDVVFGALVTESVSAIVEVTK